MDIKETDEVMRIVTSSVRLLDYMNQKNAESYVEQDKFDELEAAYRKVQREAEELEAKVDKLQKCNANMAEVVSKESCHVKRLQKEMSSLATFVDMKYNENVIQEWREHLAMVRKAHENEGNKDPESGKESNE